MIRLEPLQVADAAEMVEVLGAPELYSFIGGRPQNRVVNTEGSYQLFRVGDAVASRSIHAAIYEARRVAMAL